MKKIFKKTVFLGYFLFLTSVVSLLIFSSCARIDAGNVGIKVNMYGDDKGVDEITEVTGWAFYSPFSQRVYEFPIYVQHKEYSKEESFVVNSKDGSEFHVSPIINYSIKRDKVPYIFSKYRRSLEDIERGFLKTSVYDAFRLATNKYTADELISNRQLYEIEVRKILEHDLLKEGFIISQFTSNLVYPETFKQAIEAKNNAVQSALMAENKVKQAEAEAKIKVATAEGNAKSMLTEARAEAESNKLRQSTLTPLLIQQQWIEKWNGTLPSTVLGSNTNTMIGIQK